MDDDPDRKPDGGAFAGTEPLSSDEDALPTGLAATIAQRAASHTGRPGDSGQMPEQVDRFLIEDELGAGGMGRVYVAYDPTLDRRVAIKLVRSGLGLDAEKAYARMAREARAMAKLRHPHVVTVHEVGKHAGGLFIVMEYVEGGTLREWQTRTTNAAWQQILAMYTLAGHGLAAAHKAGLVHRDFKPDNVLVGAADGRVLVGDFGIANVFGDEPSGERPSGERNAERAATGNKLTRAGSVIGTPPYMSPEQHRGKGVDARTDQFAFCVALYEALYGVRPFAGDTYEAIAEAATRGNITPPAIDLGAPARIRSAIMRGLSSDPAARWPSMTALLAELGTEPPPRVPRWLPIAIGGLALAGGGLWFATRDRGTTDAPVVAARPIGLIAIESFDVQVRSYANRHEWREGLGDVFALLLSDIDGIKAVGPSHLLGPEGVRDLRTRNAQATPAEWASTERKAGALYHVTASVSEDGSLYRIAIEIAEVGGASIQSIELSRPRAELAKLLEDGVERVAKALDPAKSLDRDQARSRRARALLTIGDEHLRSNDFQMAWPFLEQAVLSDPRSFEAWYDLSLTRSWVLAPESQVFEAFDHALATAPTPLKKRLVEGEGKYLHHELAAARAILEPLLADATLSTQERRDALYFLGEAHWHDGHHKVGVGYFQQAVDLDINFKLPIQHLGEYSSANRDVAMLRLYSSMIATSTVDLRERAEFMQGHFEELARSGGLPHRLYATFVLGRKPTAEMETFVPATGPDRAIYFAAKALGDGDLTGAHTALEGLWTEIATRLAAGELSDNAYFTLRNAGDVVLCAPAVEEIKRIVTFMARQSKDHPVRSYARLSILAAPLVNDKTWIVRRELTDRDRMLADAIEAEISGDRPKAVELLKKLVGDPSPFWDYPERMALLRNLRALKRTAEAKALCDDTLRPAIFHNAYLPARRACLAH